MPRVLIAGCGYLGQAAADLFCTADWEVEAWTQSAGSAAKLSGKQYPVHAVDISDSKQLGARAGKFDAVIHCASTHGGDAQLYRKVYLNGARNLFEQFGASQVLFTSSTSVYAQTGGEWVTEGSPAEPGHEIGKVLRQAEHLVLSNGGIVARLAGIYGPNRSALLTRLLRGEAIIDPKKDRFVNQIHRDDAAAAFPLLLDRQSAVGEIFNVVDDQPILLSECYRWLAERLKPPAARSARSTSRRKRGESNKRVSNAKLREIGWIPRYPNFAEGMEKSVLPNLRHEKA
jgi:nucleoside-diphosphate-sugar epimerase